MFCKTLLYKKVASKMLVKLTPLLLYSVLSKAVSLKNSTLHMLLKIQKQVLQNIMTSLISFYSENCINFSIFSIPQHCTTLIPFRLKIIL